MLSLGLVLRFYLIFCHFQPGAPYESFANKKACISKNYFRQKMSAFADSEPCQRSMTLRKK